MKGSKKEDMVACALVSEGRMKEVMDYKEDFKYRKLVYDLKEMPKEIENEKNAISRKRNVGSTKKFNVTGSKNGYSNKESIDYKDSDVDSNINGYINVEGDSFHSVKQVQSAVQRKEPFIDGQIIHRSKRFMLPLGTGSDRHNLFNTFHEKLDNIRQHREEMRDAGMKGIHLNFPFLKGHNLVCGDKTCHKDAECYRRKCRCRRGLTGDGVNSCSNLCKCTVSGDPHFHTFDGQTIHLMSDCKHILSESRNFKDGCDFRIEIQNEKRGTNKFVSWPRSLDIQIYNVTVRLSRHSKIFINNEEKFLPATILGGKLRIFKSSNSMQMTTGCGIQVSFNGDDLAEVQIPQKYQGRMRGLCGDCNGIKDDLRTKDSLDVSQMKDKFSIIGLSYLVIDTSSNANSIPESLATLVRDPITDPRPDATDDVVKSEVLRRNTKSAVSKFKQLMQDED
ncbi:Hypothetical predicted protein [Octopus vulgaris]|uniref:VWFD domain-containing protein n=1 Tax=Octopus vulgaris TaxID=6645 RepID=A0AA36BQ25_OCTVU|nr:Hypothetical predicted protein [Octopus vulgaris]